MIVCACTAATISSVKLPGKIPKRGRPKGSELTVIGIPKRKKWQMDLLHFLNSIPRIKKEVYIYNTIQLIVLLIFRNAEMVCFCT